jgi:hypothetical protein
VTSSVFNGRSLVTAFSLEYLSNSISNVNFYHRPLPWFVATLIF